MAAPIIPILGIGIKFKTSINNRAKTSADEGKHVIVFGDKVLAARCAQEYKYTRPDMHR